MAIEGNLPVPVILVRITKRVYGNLGIGITIALLTVHLSFLTCLLTRNIADISCRSSAAIGSLRSLSHLNSLRRNQMTKSRSYANLSGKGETILHYTVVENLEKCLTTLTKWEMRHFR